jgi:hypothetical protein
MNNIHRFGLGPRGRRPADLAHWSAGGVWRRKPQAFTSSRGAGSASKQASGVGVDALGKKCGRHAVAAAVGCMALLGQWQWLSRHVGSCGMPSLETVCQALTSLPVQAG